MEILNYLPIIAGIKNSDFTPIFARGTIRNTDKIDIHKRLLTKLCDSNYPVAMVFSNELFLLRNLRDITNNEIKKLITTNSTWDVLILNPFDLILNSTSPIEGYNIIKKINDSSSFFYNQVYIASARFMQKIKNNDISNIESFIYIDPFVQHMHTTPLNNKNMYIVGAISNIKTIKVEEIIYSWNKLSI